MHIPDGLLDGRTAAVAAGLSFAGVGVALRQVRLRLPPRRVPLLGLAAAFVFAAQMLNFPVAGGTSGHLIGSVLVAVLLGPSAAVIVLTSVLIIQCLIFNDGGVLALGANVFNMALVGTLVGYVVYRVLLQAVSGTRGIVMASAFAAWCATIASSISCAGQLATSGKVTWSVAFPAMAGIHMIIGVGEAAITALVLVAVANARPELLYSESESPSSSYGGVVAFGLVLAFGLAVFVSPFASPWPDGLEKVAATLGFTHHASADPLVAGPIPNYAVPGIESAGAATALAGLVGIVVVFVFSFILSRILVPVTKAGTTPVSQ